MSKKMPIITVGCDPELFLIDNEKKFISPYGMINGNKKAPLKVEFGALQVDGLALEINTKPASDYDHFRSYISEVMKNLRAMIPSQYTFSTEVSATFDPEYFEILPSFQKQLGCDPDYNAYTGKVNKVERNNLPIRSAGGHIHIGWTKGRDPMEETHFLDCIEVAKCLDVMIGLPSLFWDHDATRVKTYGRPGNFRPKSYGIEYRTPSNSWLWDEYKQEYIFRQVISCMKYLFNGISVFDKYTNQEEIENAFNNKAFKGKLTKVNIPDAIMSSPEINFKRW